MKKRYIIGINEGDYGSTGSIAINILKSSTLIGLTPLFAIYEANKQCDFEIKVSSNPINEFINRFVCRLNGSDGFHNVLATKAFLRKIKDLDISIIHLHNIHGRYINLPLILEFARQKNIKVIWTLHDCWAFTGRCPHFELANCYKWKNCCGHCPTKKEYPASYLFDQTSKFLLKKMSLYKKYNDLITIVCPSRWLYYYFIQSKANFLKCVMIHNGISNNFDLKQKRQYDLVNVGNKKVFLSVAAGFDKRKGFEYINKLAEELDPKEYLFIVVGLPKNKKKVSKNIINTGYINNKDLLDYYYSISNAFINPTLEDNFPTVNLEALSHGIPVITFDTGGSPESLNNECGIVVKKGSYDEIKKAVEGFDVEMFSSKKCYEQAEKYSLEKMCDAYLELFKKVVH